ncbi:DeoR family transcriptional regulator [Staphylococcus schleiferi subsp. coagulans]|uniref:DeoR/GlpR family DNA-binding transcription regulator n=1 Tax=Staphylococcus coagulans TaxID=74706 RepID=UPI0015FBCFD5|nr:DeoR/GlpR family DNA-binding transcription regulator [Staphylococcus coagulans]MBA8759608.1 DeoR family transcriptional regulator [Staphylococcus coagulans]MBA8767612.1 DeoR family transcriptional regulator [Staphylococcus coagulans]
MLTEKRHEMILDALAQHNFLSLQHLVEYTESSASTIRRDLSRLQEEGKLTRVHGGAKLINNPKEPELYEKRTQHIEEKVAIAKKAAQLVNEGDCIYLDAGSTTLEMIPYLSAKEITVVTNGLSHVEGLLKQGIPTKFIGGDVKGNTLAVVGGRAVDFLKHYRFNKVFLGVNGIDIEAGFTTPDEREAIVKETAVSQAQQAYVLADTSKFNEQFLATIHTQERPIIITSEKVKSINGYTQYDSHFEILGGQL